MGARAIIAGKGALPGLLLAEAPAHVVAFAGVEVQAEGGDDPGTVRTPRRAVR
jgi:hypothetical protein